MKRITRIVGVVLLLLGVGAGLFLFVANGTKSKSDLSLLPTPTVLVQPTPVLSVWDDPAGFSISYPKDSTIDPHKEDVVHYAHVDFRGTDGVVTVWVKDIPAGVTTAMDAVKKDASLSSQLTFDTSMGGQPAVKIRDQATGKTTVMSVYDGVLFVLESTGDAQTFDRMISSFRYVPIESTQAQGASDTQASVDEEESIE